MSFDIYFDFPDDNEYQSVLSPSVSPLNSAVGNISFGQESFQCRTRAPSVMTDIPVVCQ